MAISPASTDREFDKFVESPTRPGKTAVEVTGNLTANVVENLFDIPETCDAIVRSVASNVETYQFKSGGVSGSLLKTITLTYTSSSLKDLVSAVSS